jgi:hypothetical protein
LCRRCRSGVWSTRSCDIVSTPPVPFDAGGKALLLRPRGALVCVGDDPVRCALMSGLLRDTCRWPSWGSLACRAPNWVACMMHIVSLGIARTVLTTVFPITLWSAFRRISRACARPPPGASRLHAAAAAAAAVARPRAR